MKELIAGNVKQDTSRTMTVSVRRRRNVPIMEVMKTVMDMVFAYRKDQLHAAIVIKVSAMMVLINVDVALIHSSVIQMNVTKNANGYLNKMITNVVSCQTSYQQGYSRKQMNQTVKGLFTSKKMVNLNGQEGMLSEVRLTSE